MEPVMGSVLAAALLDEVPAPLQIVGGALILGAAAVLQIAPRAPAGAHEVAGTAED
jgi:drug/metabolite transporter (DMT)-like permease